MRNLLKWKTILITGASWDIGMQVWLDCYDQWANTILIAFKNTPKLKERFRNLDASRYKIFSCDVTNEESVNDVITELIKSWTKLDGIFNNAWDLLSRSEFENTNWKLYKKTLEVNCKSAYLFTNKSINLLAKTTSSIVMMSSMTARSWKWDKSTHYGVAKSAISGLWKSLSYELWRKYWIRVNIVSPGYIKGSFHDKYTLEEVEKKHAIDNPLRRVGTPKDVSWVVIFLLSDLSSYVNGATIDINWWSFVC